MAKNQVATKSEAQLPAGFEGMAEDIGSGLEGVESGDLLVPFIRILQALSPVVKKRESTYVDGAEESMFFNTASEELFNGDEGIQVIPVHYTRSYTEWEPGTNGNLVAVHGDKLPAGAVPNGPGHKLGDNDVNLSGDFFVLIKSSSGYWEKALISLSKTQLKKSRKWVTALTSAKIKVGDKRVTPPIWYRAWDIISVPESNDNGSWFGWKIQPGTPLPEMEGGAEVYAEAKEFFEQVSSGKVAAAPVTRDVEEGGGGDSDAI